STLDGAASSQRDVVVLLPGIAEVLVAQHAQRARDTATGGMGHDHLVDIAALRRHEGREEAIFVGFRMLGYLLVIADITPIDDLDRTLRPHYGDLRGRPGIVHVAAQVF